MNKKLSILILVLECLLGVFFVSLFGPMVESLHAKTLVREVYILDSDGVALENNAALTVDFSTSYSFHYGVAIGPEDASDRTVTVLHNKSDEELEIVMDANGKGFTVFFFEEVSGVKITVRANDSSQKEAVITLNKRLTDIDIGQDFDN